MHPLPVLQEPWANTVNPPGWKAQRTTAIPPYVHSWSEQTFPEPSLFCSAKELRFYEPA